MGERSDRWQGSKWVRPTTRLAIYDRDDFSCCWCGTGEPPFCLDHLIPVAHGGTNSPVNLLTSCFDCNQERTSFDASDLASWFAFLGQRHGRTRAQLEDQLERAGDELDMAWARAME